MDPRALPSHGDARRPRVGDPDQATGCVVLLRRGRTRRRDPRLVPRPAASPASHRRPGRRLRRLRPEPARAWRARRVAGRTCRQSVWKALVGASPLTPTRSSISSSAARRPTRLALRRRGRSCRDAATRAGRRRRPRTAASPRRCVRPRHPEMAGRGAAAVAADCESGRCGWSCEAGPDGSLTLPQTAAWAGTFGRPEQVDAAWLVDRVFSGDRSTLRDRFDLALFAMRWTRDGWRTGVSGRARSLRGRAGAGVDARADRRARQRRGHAAVRGCCSALTCARMRGRCACSRRRWR